jgi:hypothetical protein
MTADTAVFGPILDATALELKTITCLKRWLSTYLAEFEDRHPSYAKGDLVRPRSWQADIDVRNFPERQLPAIIVVVGDETPVDGGGPISMRYGLAVGVLCKGPTRQFSRDLSRIYGAAIRLCLAQKGGEVADYLAVGTTEYREQRGNADKVAGVAELTFSVLVEDVMDIRYGPNQPNPEPHPPEVGDWPDYDPWPDVLETDVEVIHVPLDEEVTP